MQHFNKVTCNLNIAWAEWKYPANLFVATVITSACYERSNTKVVIRQHHMHCHWLKDFQLYHVALVTQWVFHAVIPFLFIRSPQFGRMPKHNTCIVKSTPGHPCKLGYIKPQILWTTEGQKYKALYPWAPGEPQDQKYVPNNLAMLSEQGFVYWKNKICRILFRLNFFKLCHLFGLTAHQCQH